MSLVAAVFLIVASAQAAPTPPALIEGKSLVDSAPVRVDPRDGKAPATIVVFLSARCPCSISHEPGLKSLAAEFRDMRFVGVNANADETLQEAAAHFTPVALPFPIVKDEGSRLADGFGALKTPHAFVLGKDGQVVYQGGVDDCHDASKATKHFLKDALLAMRAGKTPETSRARSLGCVIKR